MHDQLNDKLHQEYALAVYKKEKGKMQRSVHNNCMHLQFQPQWSGTGYQNCFCNILRELEW